MAGANSRPVSLAEKGIQELVTGEHAQYLHQARHRSRLAPVGAISIAIRADLLRCGFFLFSVAVAPEFQKVSGHCVCHGAQDQAGRTKND